MTSALLLITGILAGLTSVPLTYLAVHTHREIRHLRRSHHTLRDLIVEARRDDPAPGARPTADSDG
jgi:hypothetical protein